jgi:hypothetical protein
VCVPKWCLSLTFSDRIFLQMYYSSCSCYMPRPSFYPWLTISDQEYGSNERQIKYTSIFIHLEDLPSVHREPSMWQLSSHKTLSSVSVFDCVVLKLLCPVRYWFVSLLSCNYIFLTGLMTLAKEVRVFNLSKCITPNILFGCKVLVLAPSEL